MTPVRTTTTIALAAVVAVVMALLPAIVPPAWAQAPEGDPVERVGGTDRVATAVAVSQRFYDRTDTAVLATAIRYPDAFDGVARGCLRPRGRHDRGQQGHDHCHHRREGDRVRRSNRRHSATPVARGARHGGHTPLTDR